MLWPFALQEYIRTTNHYWLDRFGKSPHIKFTGVDSLPSFGDQHPWGYPVYVLEPKLQGNSKGIPKMGASFSAWSLHGSIWELVMFPVSIM